jgi:hypothetical protein
MIYKEHLFNFLRVAVWRWITVNMHLLIFLRAGVWRIFTVNIYLSSFVLLFQDDLQWTSTFPPLCCCLKMIYCKHLLIFLHYCCFNMIYSGHLLIFLRAAVSRWFTVNIYLSSELRASVSRWFTVNIYLQVYSFVLLFQDDLPWRFTYPPSCCCLKMIYSEHLHMLLRAAIWRWPTVNIYFILLRAAAWRWFTLSIFLNSSVLLCQEGLQWKFT